MSTDVNGDGDTSGHDLTLLLGGFGTNQSHLDFDDSGIVDGGDLAMFLAAWEQGDSPTPCTPKVPTWAMPEPVVSCPDPSIVTSNTLRDNIVKSGWAWQVRDSKTGILMVWIPLDTTNPTFTMGCSPDTSQGGVCPGSEIPVHPVTLNSTVYNNEPGFYMSVGEVTQAQWMYPGHTLPNHSHFVGLNLPVESVSYHQVGQWLGQVNTGVSPAISMRLPTEAEWEYAYRAHTTTAFHGYPEAPNGSNEPSTLTHIAWYASNSANRTHTVTEIPGSQPNGFGLYNMSGNVEEWVHDWYASYTGSSVTNPSGPPHGKSRVSRGGSWTSSAENCRASNRSGSSPDYYSSSYGFRVARNAQSPSP